MKKIILTIFTLLSFNAKSQVNITLSSINSNTNNSIVDIYFSNDTIGFYLTNIGEVFKTFDGGINWSLIHSDSSIITSSLYVGQETTSIVSTSDSVFIFSNSSFFNNKWCVKIKSSISNISFTKDTLKQWVKFPEYFGTEIWDIKRVSDSISLHYSNYSGVGELQINDNKISGSNNTKVYFSNDNGITWEEKEFTNSTLSSGPYQSFVSGDTIYAISQYTTMLHKSYNKGMSWVPNPPSLPVAYFKIFKEYLLGFSLYNGNKIYLVDIDGNILFQDTVPDHVLNMYMKSKDKGFIMGKDGMLVKINTNVNLSADNQKLNRCIEIYPNPVKNVLKVKIIHGIEILKVELFDINGKLVEVLDKSKTTFNVSHIPIGIYNIKFKTNEGELSKKIVKN